MLPNNSRLHIFLKCHGIFSRIIIGNKRIISKFKKIKIIPTIIPDHNGKNYTSTTIGKLENL